MWTTLVPQNTCLLNRSISLMRKIDPCYYGNFSFGQTLKAMALGARKGFFWADGSVEMILWLELSGGRQDRWFVCGGALGEGSARDLAAVWSTKLRVELRAMRCHDLYAARPRREMATPLTGELFDCLIALAGDAAQELSRLSDVIVYRFSVDGAVGGCDAGGGLAIA